MLVLGLVFVRFGSRLGSCGQIALLLGVVTHVGSVARWPERELPLVVPCHRFGNSVLRG